MSPCTEIQEKIAWGLALLPAEGRHTAECGACTKVAEEWSRVHELLDEAEVVVADGFADRVMARLDGERPAVKRLLDERWVQIALANMGALVTLANLVRFIAPLLISSTSLGSP